MTTPLIILALLFFPYFLLTLVQRKRTGTTNTVPSAAIALGLTFVFFGVGHFVRTDSLAAMLPSWVPWQQTIIYVTGLLEFMIAAALFHPKYRKIGALSALCVLIAFFPANVFAAFNYTGGGGYLWGPKYLLIRAPLQALLIYWAYAKIYKKLPY